MAIGTIPNPLLGKKNYILAIGVDEYERRDFDELKSCKRDIRGFISILTENYQCFDKNSITTLFDKDATRVKIMDAIRDLLYKANSSEWNLIIYFCGHGDYKARGKKGYWIPHDAKIDKFNTYISFEEIQTLMVNSSIYHILLISDSCYAGSIFSHYRTEHFTPKCYTIKSRWALTSGRKEPVHDGTNVKPSPFSEILVHILNLNSKTGKDLNVKRLCVDLAEDFERKFKDKEQMPEALPLEIKGYRHNNGQFVFIPKRTSNIPLEVNGESTKTEPSMKKIESLPLAKPIEVNGESTKTESSTKKIESLPLAKPILIPESIPSKPKYDTPLEDFSSSQPLPINLPELEIGGLGNSKATIKAISKFKISPISKVIAFSLMLLMLIISGVYILNNYIKYSRESQYEVSDTNEPSTTALADVILDPYDPKKDPNLINVVEEKPYHPAKRGWAINGNSQLDTFKKTDIVFAGSFENKDNALNILTQLKKIGYQNAEIVMKENLPYMIVVTGFNMKKKEAKEAVQSLQKRGIEAYHSEKQVDKVYRSEK